MNELIEVDERDEIVGRKRVKEKAKQSSRLNRENAPT